MLGLVPLAAAAADAHRYVLLNGFDNSCGLRSPTDRSPAYYTVVDVREGCVGCRDLCTRTPDGGCLAYQCTSAGSRCELWKRTPRFGQEQPGAECWVKLDAGTHPFEEVARLEQLESLGRAGIGGAPATASDMYKGARYVPPFPPPAPPYLPLVEAEQAFELLGHGTVCACPQTTTQLAARGWRCFTQHRAIVT